MEVLNRRKASKITFRPADPLAIQINSPLDYEGNAAKNRIWYRGDPVELDQFYRQLGARTNLYNFWSARSSPGMQMRKIHTGIPGVIVDTLSTVVLTDLNEIQFKNQQDKDNWDKIADENCIDKVFENSLKETLYIGDGAYKISFDFVESEYPIIEFYPGEDVEFVLKRGRIHEVVFRTKYQYKGQEYILHEAYGYGYIKNKLTKDDKEVDLNCLPETQNLSDYFFAGYTEGKDGNVLTKGSYMMAVPLMVYKSSKFKGRGQSIYDRKVESFDSLDEAWSQWMDALRAGRSKEYIPDSLLPRDPNTGAILQANAFDNRYIQTDADMREGAQNKITLDQPTIPHESYLATYCTALDLCLQGLISPSTLGIDVKKLDNADAQREKEKATLYTRNAIVAALSEDIKILVVSALKAYYEIHGQRVEDKIELDVTFGEYANPSFESQVETVSKGKQGGIMSLEACVDELYGDTKDATWKEEEVARLKAEQGITELEEPALNLDFGDSVGGGVGESGEQLKGNRNGSGGSVEDGENANGIEVNLKEK
jgi:hypothetical protein